MFGVLLSLPTLNEILSSSSSYYTLFIAVHTMRTTVHCDVIYFFFIQDVLLDGCFIYYLKCTTLLCHVPERPVFINGMNVI